MVRLGLNSLPPSASHDKLTGYVKQKIETFNQEIQSASPDLAFKVTRALQNKDQAELVQLMQDNKLTTLVLPEFGDAHRGTEGKVTGISTLSLGQDNRLVYEFTYDDSNGHIPPKQALARFDQEGLACFSNKYEYAMVHGTAPGVTDVSSPLRIVNDKRVDTLSTRTTEDLSLSASKKKHMPVEIERQDFSKRPRQRERAQEHELDLRSIVHNRQVFDAYGNDDL